MNATDHSHQAVLGGKRIPILEKLANLGNKVIQGRSGAGGAKGVLLKILQDESELLELQPPRGEDRLTVPNKPELARYPQLLREGLFVEAVKTVNNSGSFLVLYELYDKLAKRFLRANRSG